jgi:hypothetical protein
MIRRLAASLFVIAVAAGCGKDSKRSEASKDDGKAAAGSGSAAAEPEDKPVATGATPEEAFKNYQAALVGKDLDFLWWFVSKKDKDGSIGRMLAPMNGGNVPAERLDEFAKGFGTTPEGVRAMSKRDFDRHFLYMGFAQTTELVAGQVIEQVEMKGEDRAILHLGKPSTKFGMVREDGQWRWDMIETSRLNDPE